MDLHIKFQKNHNIVHSSLHLNFTDKCKNSIFPLCKAASENILKKFDLHKTVLSWEDLKKAYNSKKIETPFYSGAMDNFRDGRPFSALYDGERMIYFANTAKESVTFNSLKFDQNDTSGSKIWFKKDFDNSLQHKMIGAIPWFPKDRYEHVHVRFVAIVYWNKNHSDIRIVPIERHDAKFSLSKYEVRNQEYSSDLCILILNSYFCFFRIFLLKNSLVVDHELGLKMLYWREIH